MSDTNDTNDTPPENSPPPEPPKLSGKSMAAMQGSDSPSEKDIQPVNLADIADVSKNDLSDRRLDTLLHGYNTFEEVLNSSSDPITLDKRSGEPYTIIDGRHRVYLARQQGYTSIPAQFI